MAIQIFNDIFLIYLRIKYQVIRAKDIVVKIFWEVCIRLCKISLEMNRRFINRDDVTISIPITERRKIANVRKSVVINSLKLGYVFFILMIEYE